jgi:hypothetical protein
LERWNILLRILGRRYGERLGKIDPSGWRRL